MSDSPAQSQSPSRPTPPGIYDKPKGARVSAIDVVAVILSVLWLIGAGAYFLVLKPDVAAPAFGGLGFILVMLAIFMPVAMIWVAALAARASQVMREESARLQAAIDAMRQSYLANVQSAGLGAGPTVSKKLDEIAAAQRKTENTLATFTTKRDEPAVMTPAPDAAAAAAATPEDQTALALGTQAEEIVPPLPREDFIRALHFPETVEDERGFAALRRALKHRDVSKLVQAAQDVLTLLSQDGIYMDDLRPDMAHPDIWRKFANGERGRPIAALGGVRDRSSLALTAGRMKQDPIFRDAAHHFLRMFDMNVTTFARDATDAEISALSETRTARAFMLIGRVSGTFS
ncbi:hypothetical protein [Pseudaestuariivita atlantica]|uniref:Uncharacterized protein n=1 Tax=Pseudaestuariivita atlantica TaxID=1317121 RepID=A0A0L1JQS9_9RHOB|nr:hypothetical protein [Pseudaestuariivita atlantica]KNG94091.1 hypothetical protein ATO11_07555 [Pseudaestuariivita atlantica]